MLFRNSFSDQFWSYHKKSIFFIFHFLDALASLDFKLSLSESLMFLQLAHLRVFQIYFISTLNESIPQKNINCDKSCICDKEV